MLVALQVSAIFVVAVAMALSLAHALELPGKLRLTEAQYLAVQPIYYPGFTLGGAAEPIGLLLMLVLLVLTPLGTAAFWLTAAAAATLATMHAAYWILTHPVNNFWLKNVELKAAGAQFFATGWRAKADGRRAPDWTRLRDQWEASHVLRAGLGMISLILIAMAVAL